MTQPIQLPEVSQPPQVQFPVQQSTTTTTTSQTHNQQQQQSTPPTLPPNQQPRPNGKAYKHKLIPTSVWNPDNQPIPDYSILRVKLPRSDNNGKNPYLWTHNLLTANRLCYYCTQSIDDVNLHPTMDACKKKYPHYHASEVKTLLSRGLTPPPRTAVPAELSPL